MASETRAFTTPIAEAPLSPRFGPAWRLALLMSLGLVGLLGLTLIGSLVYAGTTCARRSTASPRRWRFSA